MISAQQVRDTMARYVELVNAIDVGGILALYAEDATVEDPVGQPLHSGIEAIGQFYREGLGKVQVQASLEGAIRATDNGWGAMPFRVVIHGGDQPGVIQVIDVMEFNADGRIRSMKAFWGELNFTPTSAA
ncbi:MAG: nuclear transport factor 2 family protein [Marinobacter sp.]|uniref:nuclear transport factor 2 family protein n=1 Tax=Marinobacter sp. TaxID=50741 RepID=UPI003F95675D